MDFPKMWSHLVEKAQECDYVTTFSQENKNDVRYDENKDAICFNSQATDEEYWTEIPRDEWKMAWERLRETGELSPEQFFETTDTRRGSTAVPFLQQALELPVDTDNRVVYPPKDSSDFQ